jgi:hypothetical protein
MSVTLYTVARLEESGRFITIGELMVTKSFVNRLIQDGIDREDAGRLATDAALAAFRAHTSEAIATYSDTFTRELGNGTRRARYRVIATIISAPTIPQD